MNSRRDFLRMMIGGVAAVAAERTFPFRVFSFPSEIKLAKPVLRGWMYYRFDADRNLIDQCEVWDWNMLRQHEAFKAQTLFNIPPGSEYTP